MVTPAPPHAAQVHRFIALDSLRGLAAVGVVLFHLPGLGPVGNWAVAESGYLFVDFFFVLSGFVIAASYGERLAQGFPLRRFALLRLGRVYPLHLAMVLLTLAATIAIMRPVFADNHDLWYLLRAIALLDGYALDRDNFYNGQSWSVSVELLLYGAAALLMGRGRLGIAVAALAAAAALACLLIGWQVPVWSQNVQRGIAGFALGAGVFAIYRRPGATRLFGTFSELATGVLAIGMVGIAGDLGNGRHLVIFPFAALVLVFAGDRGLISRLLAYAPARALGRWSYSIYLTHFFLIGLVGNLALMAGMQARDGWEPIVSRLVLPGWGQTLLLLAMLALVIAVSALTYALIEEPGRRWSRRKAEQWGAGRAERAAPAI